MLLLVVPARPHTLMECRCYEEMTEEDVKRSKLVFDESAGGCGNGKSLIYGHHGDTRNELTPIALHSECFSMWAATAVSCYHAGRRLNPADRYSVQMGTKSPAYTVGPLGRVRMA